ncbi:MAG: hypothetical protein KAW19_08245 [Candidatus Aminicenantes bacterium]|nr:hypothetical protein [Candidatus Aminicenantes bacterium]
MTEGIEIQTMPDLVKHIIDHWKSEQIKALKEEEAQKEKLTVEIRKEQGLEKRLKESRSIAEKMEREFLEIEAKTEEEKRKQVEQSSVKEEDVKSGKITLAEFLKVGKTKSQIYDESIKRTMKDLEQGLKAIRSKNKETLELEKELLETQTRIRYLIIEPGRILQRVLKDLGQFAEREIGFFLEEVHSSKTELKQVENRLNLTEGRSLGPGYSWSRLTPREASQIQFDPILPFECIEALKSKLALYKDSEMVNVTFFLRTKGIDITSIQTGGEK